MLDRSIVRWREYARARAPASAMTEWLCIIIITAIRYVWARKSSQYTVCVCVCDGFTSSVRRFEFQATHTPINYTPFDTT